MIKIATTNMIGFSRQEMLNILIAEAEEAEFGYEVIGVVNGETEAREMAASDMADRERQLDAGDSPMCPFVYRMFQRGVDGYIAVLDIPATEAMRS